MKHAVCQKLCILQPVLHCHCHFLLLDACSIIKGNWQNVKAFFLISIKCDFVQKSTIKSTDIWQLQLTD